MRVVKNMNSSWLFTKEDIGVQKKIPSDLERIDLPHTWNANDGQDGGNDYYRGRCWYFKKLNTEDLMNDQQYLEIQGANSSADVYLNGKHLAHHDGGYSTFRIDLTDAKEEENILCIGVDNSANEYVYPQNADFTFYGGVYRDVNLITVGSKHFDLDYYGSSGIQITPSVEGKDAKVEIIAFLNEELNQAKLIYQIYDQDKHLLLEEESLETKAIFNIQDAHLWQGRKDPYLYSAKVKLVADNEVVDEVESKFGIRSFFIDPDKGFFLNGESYPLHGVSRHQDRAGVGNALSKENHQEDMELIAEMGANTIRLAHYQHDQYFYDLCDAYGMVVWAEIPYISKHMPSANENTKSQMKELIIQNYNHPSIVVWGLSNEITISGGPDEDMTRNHIELNQMVHEMDPTRLTVMACVSMLKHTHPFVEIPDVVSYNHYLGWYTGKVEMNGPWYDDFHKNHPNKPIGISEYGAEALNWHSSDPKQGDYTEEYQAYYHEEMIKQLFTRPFIWASHVWNMFDFAADARDEGGEAGMNHKGLVSFDRSYKKDSYYAYKAWLSEEKFVHICSKRYIDRVEDITRVKVYSNIEEVELYANGELVEKKKSADHFFTFLVKNEGETKLVAKAGDCFDEAIIRKVDEPNEEYILKDSSIILNWFDIEERKDVFTLNDRIKDIYTNEEAKEVLMNFIRQLNSGDVNEEFMQVLSSFTVLRFFNLTGKMYKLDITKEMLLELNEKLNAFERSEAEE